MTRRCGLCDRPHYARGWCHLHYQRWRLHGSPSWEPLRRERPPCTMPGCERPHLARGLCAKHYARWWRHGDATVIKVGHPPILPSRPCAADGCDRPVKGARYCKLHWARVHAWGHPDVCIRGHRRYYRLCDEPGCLRRVHGQGLCDRHYGVMRTRLGLRQSEAHCRLFRWLFGGLGGPSEGKRIE